VRATNEDAHVVRGDRGLFVVCDGMGGAAAGEVASHIAADTIVRHLSDMTAPDTSSNGSRTLLPHTAHLVDAVRRSNAVVYRQARHNVQQADMGTTVVTAVIDRSIAGVAHVGDSRAYLWYDHRLVQLTRDHSLAGCEHVLMRALGREPEVQVGVREVPLQAGDYLLLCSDGLTRMVPDDVIADAIGRLRAPQQICDELVETAIHRGGADNITVVVVEVLGTWWRRLSMCWDRHTGGAHDAATHRQA
jgi:protein phosphatase